MARTREQAEELAWRPWERIGAGEVDQGLALLDDGGTWWEMATRTEQPMARMKALLAETVSLFPMLFAHVGPIVEDTQVALMGDLLGGVDNSSDDVHG